MRSLARLPVMIAWALAMTGQDELKLSNVPGCISRAIVWGKFKSPPIISSPAIFEGGCDKIAIGNLEKDTAADAANQVVAFTVGRPPAFKSNVDWKTTGAQHTIRFPSVYKIPVKIYVVTTTPLDLATFKKRMAIFLILANDRLKQVRT